MYFDPRTEPHGLAHSPYTALVVPRPIGWISTVGAAGVVNLAPQLLQHDLEPPPFVMFSSADRKDCSVTPRRRASSSPTWRATS
jgi:flavin reductase (DIM6/NTAB) family NADH-FMN oxidoreductase RutF